jgi:hypothetical protein
MHPTTTRLLADDRAADLLREAERGRLARLILVAGSAERATTRRPARQVPRGPSFRQTAWLQLGSIVAAIRPAAKEDGRC